MRACADYDANHANSEGTTLGDFLDEQGVEYKGYTIDADGITVKAWKPSGEFLGRFPSVKQAKKAIDEHIR